jgi:hypothetical protein
LCICIICNSDTEGLKAGTRVLRPIFFVIVDKK